ncbi:two-component system response regulator RppA [Leptolyngbya sp. KIOST-1]|jgi:two-component system Ni(II)/redox-responsive regulator NrsR|uniref:two-component system response regulator RppA n=1 Tax=Cyanophyceae TaxID=3028117 RepID=UPI00056D9EF3|nr:two-component system response regulator RppA [Leptolyngbya sp. KIOST-1]PSR19193.1 DNA-binding response regulator [filamentous cyanobacterium CCP3]
MRILLVEDEEDLGLAIKQVLMGEKYVVDWVTDGAQAWYCLENQWTDYTLAIVDWLLPELSGLELCQRLRAYQNPLPVLMLTALGQPENRVTGLDAGADDYLVKPFVMEELLARLRAIQRRSPQLQPQQLTVGAFTLDDANTQLQVELPGQPAQTIPLTLKEFQVLTYLMQNCDRIIPGSKIRYQLWDLDDEPVSNVVAAQIRLLRRKLAKHGCACPIETIPGQGYRFNSSL